MNRSLCLLWLRRITFFGVYAGLLMPLIFIPSVIFPFVFSKLIVFQALIGLTFPAYLLMMWMDPTARPRKHVLLLAISAYFIAVALSVVTAMDPMRAWWGNQERMNGLFTVLHFFAWMCMIVSVIKTWEDWKRLLRYQVVVGALVGLTAVWQRWVNPNVFFFEASDRVGGILDNPIYMGVYQMFMFFFLALLWIKDRVTLWRAIYGVCAVIGIGAFVAAQSRGPLVGMFAGLMIFGIYVGLFSKDRRYRFGVAGALLVAVLAYGGLYLARDTAFVKSSGLGRFVLLNTTVDTRLIAWKIAWQGFKEHPLLGWGYDNFHILFNQRYNPQSLRYTLYETWFDRAHNTVFDVLSMTGILGFVTFMSIFAAIFWSTYRAYKRGWLDLPFAALLFALPVAYFVQNLFVFDHPAGFSLSFLLYAFIIAATNPGFMPVSAQEKEQKPHLLQPHEFSWPFALGLWVVAAILVWRTSYLPFRVSQKAISAGQLFANPATNEQALALAKEAASTWTPYADEQAFLMSRNLIGVAANDQLKKLNKWQEWYALADQASRLDLGRHPYNTQPQYIYARLLNETMGDIPENRIKTEEQYKVAIATSPKRQQLYQGLARYYIQMNRIDEALTQLAMARDFDTDNGYGYWMHGISLLYDKNERQAGAQEIVASFDKPFPYRVSGNPRDTVPALEALNIVGQKERMDSLIVNLPYSTEYDKRIYAQIAYQLHLAGRSEAEAEVLRKAAVVYPDVPTMFQQGLEALQQANNSSTKTTVK